MKTVFFVCVVLLSFCSLSYGQSFSANLVSSGVIQAGAVASSEVNSASASFQLSTTRGDPSATMLSYVLTLDSFDIDGTKTADLADDVTAIHLHTLTQCAAATCVLGDTAGTTHVLNIFGAPREDDADLTVDVASSTVSGIWDPTDENTFTPAPSSDPNDFLDELENRQLFIMVHTREFPGGAVGGIVVPEPSSFHTAFVGAGAVLTAFRFPRRKRRQKIC